MIACTTYGKFQEQMNSYYRRTGSKLQFMEMINRMLAKGLLDPHPAHFRIPADAMAMSDEDLIFLWTPFQ